MPRPRRLQAVAALLLGGGLLAGAAHAAGGDAEKVRHRLDLAVANIQHARCGGDAFCEPASPTEIAAPPLTLTEAASALNRGVVSGLAAVCGLEWRRLSFQPMVEYWRGQKKSERQIALIGILHGMTLGETQAAVAGKPCTDKLRHDVEAQFSLFP